MTPTEARTRSNFRLPSLRNCADEIDRSNGFEGSFNRNPFGRSFPRKRKTVRQ